MEMPPYSVKYSITCHLTPSIKNGDKKVGTTAQISWVLHIFAKAVRRSHQPPSYPLCTPSHPWLARSLPAFSLLSGCSYISVVAVIPLCHSPWTDGEYTGSCECSPVAAPPPAPVFNRCDGAPGLISAVIKSTRCQAPAAALAGW